MSRLFLGDVSRWDTGGPGELHFDCGDGRSVRFDVIAESGALLQLVSDDGETWVAGRCAPGVLTDVRFSAQGGITVRILAPGDSLVSVRRYDDEPFVSYDETEKFVTYDPTNFVDTDLDRMQRLMQYNQLLMMQKLEAKFDAELSRLQAKENGNGKTSETSAPAQEPDKEAGDQLEASPSGSAAKDEVTQ